MSIPDGAKSGKEFLKECPTSPCFENHIEILRGDIRLNATLTEQHDPYFALRRRKFPHV